MKPKDESEKKGGRKKASIACPGLEENLRQVVSDHTAGDPMREDVVWTYLSSTEIAGQLERLGTPIGPDTVRRLLEEFGFHKRQAEKTKTMGDAPFRNEQFENIARLKQRYVNSPNPIISMDTKKKELLGEFFRAGDAWSNGANGTFDHDFPSYADGKLVPHGLYGPFGKKCPIHQLNNSATQHLKKMPRMSSGRRAIDCNFRRARSFSSSLVFA
jgi:hypothetical protein